MYTSARPEARGVGLAHRELETWLESAAAPLCARARGTVAPTPCPTTGLCSRDSVVMPRSINVP